MKPLPFVKTPLKLTISITQTCNLNCLHCYGRCGKEPDNRELNVDEWLRFIDYLVDNGFVQVFFEGGEPFIKPGFLDILKYASPKLLTWVRTHGTLIDRNLAQELRDIRVGTICVDLLGVRSETHDRMTDVPGSHDLAVASVRHLVDAGIPVYLLIILNRYNVEELQDYLEFAHQLGARAVGILRLYPIGRAKDRWPELALSLQEMMTALKGIKPPAGLKLMQSWHPKDGNCCYQNAAVNAFGDSIGCPYLREFVNYGNIREVPFLETWKHPLYERLRDQNVDHACTDCSLTQKSDGGCRSTAYAFTRNWDAGDPFCVKLNKGVDLRVLPKWLLQTNAEHSSSSD